MKNIFQQIDSLSGSGAQGGLVVFGVTILILAIIGIIVLCSNNKKVKSC